MKMQHPRWPIEGADTGPSWEAKWVKGIIRKMLHCYTIVIICVQYCDIAIYMRFPQIKCEIESHLGKTNSHPRFLHKRRVLLEHQFGKFFGIGS